MERVQELIDKLRQQHQQNEGPEKLLATLQSLQEILVSSMRKEAPAAGKVAVVLPPKRRTATVAIGAPAAQAPKPVLPVASAPAPTAKDLTAEINKEGQNAYVPVDLSKQETSTVGAEPPATPVMGTAASQALEIPQGTSAAIEAPEAHAAYMPVPEPQQQAPPPHKEKQPYLLQKPPAPQPVPPPALPAEAPKQEEREVYHLHFDTPDDAAPTLTQQQYGKAPRELHETIGETKESLNDRLKQNGPELAHKLKEAPIKDLRRAIGVNDKFLFVRELFRDDEAMYERSLKTINNFHILAEAEYWISRELKVKLGWDDSSPTVQAFYQLVKRRFS